METMIAWHRRRHPHMEPQDLVKLVFQAQQGCGHMLGSEETVTQRILTEENALTPDPHEPLTEPLGPDFVRVNLRRCMAENLPALWIARLMKRSQLKELPPRSAVVETLKQLGEVSAAAAAERLISEPEWLPSHTEAYHAAYAPAYRVISTRCAAALPVLLAVAGAQKDRLLICIDGPCGSGKTTLAELLGYVLDASVVPMDDFFLPHPLKTPQRLAQPGGNADWERVVRDVVTPLKNGQQIVYRPYDCHANAFAEEIVMPRSAVTVIEGSYSLMPAISDAADLRVFLRIGSEEQRQRILQRNGTKVLQMFIDRWIPLEQAYFTHYSLPDDRCLVLQQSVNA